MTPTNRGLLWIGDMHHTTEFCHVVHAIRGDIEVHHCPTVNDAFNDSTNCAFEPTIICLAETHSGQMQQGDVFRLIQRWPLSRIISVSSCLSDGRRRSGPVLKGVLEVPWHDFPARMKVWLQRIDSGATSSLTHPMTSRRDERWFAEAVKDQPFSEIPDPPTVTAAASSRTMVEAVGELVAAAGGRLEQCVVGKPVIQDTAEVIIWDLQDSLDSQLEWIRLLRSQRSHRTIALLCSFPRGDTAEAAMDAGATAILGRPTDCEAIRGVLSMAKTDLLASP